MRALIDGDIVIYKAGFGAQANGNTSRASSLNNCQYIIRKYIKYLRKYFDIEDVIVYVTSDDKSNFRFKTATIQPYKGNRTTSIKPIYYAEMKEHLIKNFSAKLVHGEEADDAMGRESSSGDCVVVSADKDMRMIPGWHYEMGDRAPYYVEDPGYLTLEPVAGKRYKLFGTGKAWYYAQILMGDKADNVPGLPYVSDVKAYKILGQCTNEYEFVKASIRAYHRRGFNMKRYCEVGELLWIRRD